ncbi:MAG: hypothetical protein WEA31_02050, partial [Pirellulales bacterium]
VVDAMNAAWLTANGMLLLMLASGCSLVPEVRHEPAIQNPFPQLSKIAVAPFFNQSGEATVNGEQVAEAYFQELQQIPGFEVVPVRVTHTLIQQQAIDLGNPDERRRLAEMLGVDAVVIGSITEYRPYYPPRLGLAVRWYAANPCYHPIPAGYGLPWGTAEEEFIPDNLVYEAEMELARAQMKTQSPQPPRPWEPQRQPLGEHDAAADAGTTQLAGGRMTLTPATIELTGAAGAIGATLPPDWPDPSGFVPDGPAPTPAPCRPTNEPVLSHTQLYVGNDSEFTAALESYYEFRDDARFGGWQSYLQRSDDFIRFCCFKHIAEMLTARGGSGESRLVYRWSSDR